MKRNFLSLAAALSVCVVRGDAAGAVLQSFDQLFAGDDPTEGFAFELPFAPVVPSELRFDGFAENLAVDETGVRFLLRWNRTSASDGGELSFPGEPDFAGVRLPGADPVSGSVRVPIQFGATMDYSPGGVLFVVEGLGPADYFRLVGDLTIQPVPEPATRAFLALVGVAFVMARGRAVRN